MDQQLTVAVAGATGFVGRHVVAELLARGHSVRALVRDREKARRVLPREAALAEPGDIRDCQACVNAIGILRETWGNSFRAVHVNTTRTLIDACRRAGAARFVQVSAMGVSDDGKTGYQKSKYEAEQLVRRSGL